MQTSSYFSLRTEAAAALTRSNNPGWLVESSPTASIRPARLERSIYTLSLRRRSPSRTPGVTRIAIFPPILAIAFVQLAATSAAWLLRLRERLLKRLLPYLVALAVGVLLATSLLHLLPEAVAQLGNTPHLWYLVGAAMLLLFVTERLFFVLTGKDAEPEVVPAPTPHHHHAHSTRPFTLILASMVHSLVDGAAVAVAFLTSPRLGWLAALAVALHEIPHRMGDFAVLVHLHVPLSRALRLIALAGVPSFLGVAAVLLLGARSTASIAWLLPLSAGSFLYIATVNLLPELQHECKLSRVLLQLGAVALGVALVRAVGLVG